MVIVWGITHVGKVDEVPGGLFHVVTQFSHLCFIPLVPRKSFVVLETYADRSFRGVEIPLSLKSVFAGWLRGWSVAALVATPGLLFLGLAALAYGEGQLLLGFSIWFCLAAGITLAMACKLEYFTQATYERATQLANRVGLSDRELLALEIAYCRISEQQAQAELVRREAAQRAAELQLPDVLRKWGLRQE